MKRDTDVFLSLMNCAFRSLQTSLFFNTGPKTHKYNSETFNIVDEELSNRILSAKSPKDEGTKAPKASSSTKAPKASSTKAPKASSAKTPTASSTKTPTADEETPAPTENNDESTLPYSIYDDFEANIDLETFPNTFAGPYWTSDRSFYTTRYQWSVNFFTGQSYNRFFPTQKIAVRLVRSFEINSSSN